MEITAAVVVIKSEEEWNRIVCYFGDVRGERRMLRVFERHGRDVNFSGKRLEVIYNCSGKLSIKMMREKGLGAQ